MRKRNFGMKRFTGMDDLNNKEQNVVSICMLQDWGRSSTWPRGNTRYGTDSPSAPSRKIAEQPARSWRQRSCIVQYMRLPLNAKETNAKCIEYIYFQNFWESTEARANGFVQISFNMQEHSA
jgi:hypothetical protein